MDWNSNLFWCLAGAFLSLLSGLLFYYLGIKRKRLSYEMNTVCLISNNIQQIKGLKVKYKSSKIDELYSTKISIKNIGNSTIEKQDFATTCPILISTNGYFLLNKENDIHFYPVHKSNNIYPIFDINNSNERCNHIIITFDYLSKYESFSCSLFHTGDISFDGILKEGEILNNAYISKRRERYQYLFTTLAGLLGVLLTILYQFITEFITNLIH